MSGLLAFMPFPAAGVCTGVHNRQSAVVRREYTLKAAC
jgi:hypothetical protein